jgi:uncharacterized membrane protein YphA (DoxX/SURF4 family)
VSVWIFLRLLGAVHLVAGWSLWTQIAGLIGSQGLLPAARMVEQWKAHGLTWTQVPTLTWWFSSDAALSALCLGQLLGGVLAMVGFCTGPSLVLAGLCAVSLIRVGGPFLSFQWDVLLVETTVLACFLVRWRDWRPGGWRRQGYRATGVLLLRVLLFKLMFSSGVVKLASGDPVWANGTALEYHFFTQPLPTWTAWYVHHAPPALLRAACWILFAIELALPFALFLGRRPRAVAGGCFLLLMAGIAATGNYTYFNGLTAALSALALDDRAWHRLGFRSPDTAAPPPSAPRSDEPSRRLHPARAGSAFALLALVPVHLWQTAAAARWVEPPLPPPWSGVHAALQRGLACNGYGLFAVMTTRRPEISVELSADGLLWTPLEFPHKPGDIFKRPGFVAPHQPRLDWQMWFAALTDGHPQPWQANPWLLALLQALLEERRPVQRLFSVLPTGFGPPRFARCMVSDYTFTTPGERAANGAWWKRVNPPRVFIPPVSLPRRS